MSDNRRRHHHHHQEDEEEPDEQIRTALVDPRTRVVIYDEAMEIIEANAGPCYNAGQYGPMGIQPGCCTCGHCRAKRFLEKVREGGG